jgi:transposase InsO family protein
MMEKEDKTMDESMRHSIALFRYGLIAPLINKQVQPKYYFEEITNRIYEVPYYGEKRIAAKTIQDWCLQYKKYGFEGLKPKKRSDRGRSRRLSPEDEEHILALRKKFPHAPVTVFYRHLMEQGELYPKTSYFTIYRLLKKYNLVGKQILPMPERKRFAHDQVNALWQGDLSHGPSIRINGKAKKTFLIGYIDDCSRVVPYAQFFTSEKFEGLRIVTKEALLRYGKPKTIYSDNGKIYRSETLQYACAQLGITLLHTQPYDPQSKGKIERFFKTVQTRFYPLLEIEPVKSLEELNERFWKWLEEDYHRKPHASLDGKTPHAVFQSQLHTVSFVEDVQWLDSIFLKRDFRKVKTDGTITLNKQLYEVPPRFIGQLIEIRYDENGVYVYEEGKEVAKCIAVRMHDNAHVKRHRSPFALDIEDKGEGEHV